MYRHRTRMRAVLALIALGFMVLGQGGVALAMPAVHGASAGHHMQVDAPDSRMPCCESAGMHACASPGGVVGCLPSGYPITADVHHDVVPPAVVRMPDSPALTLPDKPPKA